MLVLAFLPTPMGFSPKMSAPHLAQIVDMLKQDGARFRNDIVIGNGGKQILLDDPSGNAIELIEPPR